MKSQVGALVAVLTVIAISVALAIIFSGEDGAFSETLEQGPDAIIQIQGVNQQLEEPVQ